MKCHIRYFSLLVLSLLLTLITAAVHAQESGNSAPPPDLTGTWIGESHYPGYTAYCETYITKLSGNGYSGINYLQWRKNGDNTPLSDPSVRKLKKLFVGRLVNHDLISDEIDTIQTLPSVGFKLIKNGSLHFINSKEGPKLLNVESQANGFYIILSKKSRTIPDEYANLIINDLSLQIDRVECLDANKQPLKKINYKENGSIRFHLKNNSSIDFKGLEIWLTSIETVIDIDDDNSAHRIIDVSKHEEQPGDFQIPRGFFAAHDSVRFTIAITVNSTLLATKTLVIPLTESAIAQGPPRPVSEDSTLDKLLTGCWRNESLLAGEQGYPISRFDLVEFHDNYTCISRNESNNSTKSTKFFAWGFSDDTLTIGDAEINTRYLCNIDNGLLSMNRMGGGVGPAKISLKKISANPFEKYKDYLPAQSVLGTWRMTTYCANRTIYYQDDEHVQYYDIHPSTDFIGEMITYVKNRSLRPPEYDSIIFVKYMAHVNPFAEGLSNIFSSAILKVKKGRFFTEDEMNLRGHYETYFHFSDGLLVITGDNGTYYFLKAGPPRWTDPAAFHEKYNAHFPNQILMPYGVHWVECTFCHGSGSGEDALEGTGNYNYQGNQIYRHHKTDCMVCGGEGGRYFNDVTGERVIRYW